MLTSDGGQCRYDYSLNTILHKQLKKSSWKASGGIVTGKLLDEFLRI